MEKYKVCPACGKHNPPTMLECIDCESDLSGVRVVDELLEKKEQEISVCNNHKEEPKMIRLCDCGTKNPAQNRKCISCGEDISIFPIIEDVECQCEDPNRCVLSALEDNYTFQITEKNVIIGREHCMQEYLQSKTYVSRKHAEILVEENKVKIRNFSKTNYTFINNNKIETEDYVEIKDGDEIGLGGNCIDGQRQSEAAYFIVRL